MIKSKKILSIIIPVYNMEKYIINCLESIGKIESSLVDLILVDDGSTDGSGDICREYSKKYGYKYIYQKNKGCSSARNLGIEKSNSEYIWFIDSDDCIEENSVSLILNELKENNKELLVFGIKVVDKNKKNIEKLIPKSDMKENFYNERDEIFNSPCNKIYNCNIIKEYNIKFPITSHLGEDLAFNFKYLDKINKIEIIEEGIYYYYRRGEGATSNIEKRLEIFLSFDDILKFLDTSFAKKNIYRKYFKKNCIDFVYSSILKSNLSFKEKIKKIKMVDKEIKLRKNILGTDFKLRRYQMKWKFLRKEIKKYIFKGE